MWSSSCPVDTGESPAMSSTQIPAPPQCGKARTEGQLRAFLGGYQRSRAREYMLTTRLVHDLTTAAAASGYDLLVYLPTVDADGFDVVFDDRQALVPMQLKSVVAGGKASGWTIRRSLIRPAPEQADVFGFESSPAGTGRGGGVILTTVTAAGESVRVKYAYTDLVILSAIWMDIVKRPKPQRTRLLTLRRQFEEDPKGSVEIPRSAFMTAGSAGQLLALAGLSSHVDNSWRHHMLDLLRHQHLGVPTPGPPDELRNLVSAGLRSLADEPR